MGMEFMYFNEVVVQFFQLCIMKEKVETFSLRFSLLPYEQIRTIEYFLINQPAEYLGLKLRLKSNYSVLVKLLVHFSIVLF